MVTIKNIIDGSETAREKRDFRFCFSGQQTRNISQTQSRLTRKILAHTIHIDTCKQIKVATLKVLLLPTLKLRGHLIELPYHCNEPRYNSCTHWPLLLADLCSCHKQAVAFIELSPLPMKTLVKLLWSWVTPMIIIVQAGAGCAAQSRILFVLCLCIYIYSCKITIQRCSQHRNSREQETPLRSECLMEGSHSLVYF